MQRPVTLRPGEGVVFLRFDAPGAFPGQTDPMASVMVPQHCEDALRHFKLPPDEDRRLETYANALTVGEGGYPKEECDAT